ncbi:dockerin type I domain-containing protein [Ruminococcus albus]|uniref:Listeria/Bacterioides repeat-containing protein n=1 Tax=Ruminococcus albus TaxID=1264 RepID=A0A1I1J380_RUMAL|nr:dockerin type I domain-containing protein [Ruminococcus albus]SFC42936.1 Listeria/Bacterioides repeat-containing protein [Ruminococcus albus]
MNISFKHVTAAVIALTMSAGFVPSICGSFQMFEGTSLTAYAADVNTAKVSNYDELKAAIENENISTIIITADIDVPCETIKRSTVTTLQLVIDRSLTIESAEGKKFTIKRTAAEGANSGSLTSVFGIKGNGKDDGYNNVATNTVEVEFRNIIIDGGAVWSEDGITNTSPHNSGVSGRAMIDVFQGAVLNLGDGLELRNSSTTNSTDTTCSDGGTSANYGGAVRVDYTRPHGGGTVNVKAGSVIHDCYANGGWGGALGAYNFAHLNVYGGTIYNCASGHGGAIGCTYRAGTSRDDAATVNMYGGYIHDCYANYRGGAINFDGNTENYVLGGKIENCHASLGGAIAMSDGNVILHLPDIATGQLTIEGCGESNFTPDFGYSGLGRNSSGSKLVLNDNNVVTISFDAMRSDDDKYASLTITKQLDDDGIWQGNSLGEAFPGDPVQAGYVFDGWYDNKEYSGVPVTAQTVFDKDTTLYAKWKDHDHEWSYTADKNTITAECTADSICNAKNGLTLTLCAPEALTYDGKEKSAYIADDYNKAAFPDNYTIEYYKGKNKLSAAPVDAGDYTAKVKVGDAVASVDFTVSKAELTVTSERYSGTYDEAAHGITVDIGDSDAVVYYASEELTKDNYKTVGTTEDLTFSDAGEYTVYFYVVSDNYIPVPAGGSNTISIAKAEAKFDTKPTAIADLKFNGEEQALVLAGSSEDGRYVYAVSDSEEQAPDDEAYSEDIPDGKEAGTYFVWFKVKGDKNTLDTEAECVEAVIDENSSSLGDVNNDGKINVTDITKIAAHVKGKKLLKNDEFIRADVNKDGKITVTDITKVAAHVKGKKLLK